MLEAISKLEEHQTPGIYQMHAIRKEFLKKVFAAHVKQIPIKSNVKYDSDAKEEAGYASPGAEGPDDKTFGITTATDRKKVKERVLNNVDQMDVKLVFTLY